MALSSATVRVDYSGNGSTTSFAVTFVFWDDSDITVVHRTAAGVETTWVDGTQYTFDWNSDCRHIPNGLHPGLW
jgi:hypothetical protein